MSATGPIFVGGTGRSGTTVLVRMLGLHPDVMSLHWESQFLVSPGGLLGTAELGWPRRGLSRFVKSMRGRWFRRQLQIKRGPGLVNWFRRQIDKRKGGKYEAGLCREVDERELDEALDFLLDGVERLDADDRAGSLALVGAFTHRLFGPATERAGARRWCEKTPRNILFVDRLAEAFPDMKMLHIVRDGRDVVASMMSRGFWPVAPGHEFPELSEFRGEVTAEKAAGYWRTVLEMVDRIAVGLGPERMLELRFEDLVADTSATVEGMSEFLGLAPSRALLEYRLNRPNIGRWKDDLTDEEVAVVEEICGPMLEAKGYV